MLLTNRRRLLTSGLALGAAAAGARTAWAQSGPTAFGARGDGIADDTAPLLQALRQGGAVDGGGRTFGISGQLNIGAGFRGLSNCTIRQLGQNDHARTVLIRDAADFHIANVTVIRGQQNDIALAQRDMDENAGIWIAGCQRFTLDGVSVQGGGIGTGVAITRCDMFTATDVRARRILYRLNQRPSDEVIQGIWVNASTNFQLVRPTASELGGQDDQGFIYNNSRGLAVSGSSMFKIIDVRVSQCGEGLDLTGSDGNHDFEVSGGHAADCWLWGLKFSNSASRGRVSGAVAERCGLGGFVVSGATGLAQPPSNQIEIADCQALDCGRPGSPNTTFGFGIPSTGPGADYPRQIHFVRCRAEDRRSPAGMKWGFFNEINTPPGQANTIEGCTQSGALIAPTRGFG